MLYFGPLSLIDIKEGNDGTIDWFIGFFMGKNNDGTLRVNHFVRLGSNYDVWRRKSSVRDDIQDVYEDQIISMKVTGNWFIGQRMPVYVVEDWNHIHQTFEETFM